MAMKPENKKAFVSFLWKLLTAVVAALSGSLGVSAATNHVLPLLQ